MTTNTPALQRVASRTWHAKNRDKSRENDKKWRATNPTWSRDYYRKYKRQAGARAKLRARWAVKRALARGEIVRPLSCERCGAGGRVQAHHEDYRQQLAVTWICRSCHALEHRKW